MLREGWDIMNLITKNIIKKKRKKMGKTMLGGSQRMKDMSLLTPQQSGFLSSALGPEQQQLAGGAYSDLLQPYNPQGFGDLFQKSFIDPSLEALERQIIPGIKESFADSAGSSALNRALAQSATDVSTGLGQQYMNFYNQQQANKLNALSGLGGLAGQRTFEPHISQQQGILGNILSAGGQLGAGYLSGNPFGQLQKYLQQGQQQGQQQTNATSQYFTPRGGAIGGGGMAFGR